MTIVTLRLFTPLLFLLLHLSSHIFTHGHIFTYTLYTYISFHTLFTHGHISKPTLLPLLFTCIFLPSSLCLVYLSLICFSYLLSFIFFQISPSSISGYSQSCLLFELWAQYLQSWPSYSSNTWQIFILIYSK